MFLLFHSALSNVKNTTFDLKNVLILTKITQ